MWVIFQGDDLGMIHMLEAALISEFHMASGCKNAANSGGEGGLNRKHHLGPPYFVYVTGGRADQAKWVGWKKSQNGRIYWGGERQRIEIWYETNPYITQQPGARIDIINNS